MERCGYSVLCVITIPILSVKVQVNSLKNTHFQVKSNLSSIFGKCHLGTAERQRELQHKSVVQHTDTK